MRNSFSHYVCFLLTTEKAFEERQKFRLEVERAQSRAYWKKPGRLVEHRENNKAWYNRHKSERHEKGRIYYYLHQETMRENSFIRRQINTYNPVWVALQRLKHLKTKERREAREKAWMNTPMNVPFNTHLTIVDEMAIDALIKEGKLGDARKYYFTLDS